MTFPFPIFVPRVLVETLVDRTSGTAIGDMTVDGGLASAFDGVTNQASNSSARRASSTSAYIGKTYSAAKRISRVIAWSSNNNGISVNPPITLKLRGKNGAAPSSASDGTLLGTLSLGSNNTNTGNQITSTDAVSGWTHVWIEILPNANGNIWCAELVIYEML
jgi:hypothetical protein